MPQIPYRANLASAEFPLTLAKSARSVIIPGSDQVYDRLSNPAGGQSGAQIIPQAIFLENVLPTTQGYKSVGYKLISTLNKTSPLRQVIEIPGGTLTFTFFQYILVFEDDTCYNFIPEVPGFNLMTVPANWEGNLVDNISTAVVNGRVFIYNGSAGVAFRFYELTAPTIIANVAYTGVFSPGPGIVTVVSICFSFNYQIILHEHGLVQWSSTTDPTDFVASLVTGAGSFIVGAVKGRALFLKEHPQGFIIYTQSNAVFAQYTGNARYPFKFTEIADSAGAFGSFQVTGGQNVKNQIAITRLGEIRGNAPAGAQSAFAQLSDFLAYTRTYDTFDPAMNTFSEAQFPVPGVYPNNAETLPAKACAVWYVQNNYIIFSYSTIGYTYTSFRSPCQQKYDYALVYDVSLNRWGKIKVPHCAVFGLYKDIYFFQDNGATKTAFVMSFDIYATGAEAHSGVLLLGKFQLLRNRFLTIEQMDVESTQSDQFQSPKNFSVFITPSLDGKNFDPPVIPYLKESQGSLNSYLSHTESLNQSVGIKGAFDLVSIDMLVAPGSKR